MFYFVKCQSGERRNKLVKRILNLDQQPCPSFDVSAGGMFWTPPVIRWALEEWTRFICLSCLFNDSDGTKENRGALFLEDSSSKAQLSVFDYIHSQSEYYISTPTNYSESEKFQNFGEQMSPVVCRGTILGRQESHQTSDLVSCLDSKVKNLKSQEEWSKRSGMRI